MASTPAYAATPRVDIAAISSANTNRDGTGSITTLATAVAAGTKWTSITVNATSTTTAGMVRIFISVNSGSTWRLYDEIPVVAVTPSASAPAFRIKRNYEDLALYGTTQSIGITTHNAESFHVTAHGADF